ncbi:hypothetical protein CE91St58_48810 [Lachnospiraceae bacterium]|nr:hypothetical protein CE91St58_48810 [Lachnospiraceae bacterium]
MFPVTWHPSIVNVQGEVPLKKARAPPWAEAVLFSSLQEAKESRASWLSERFCSHSPPPLPDEPETAEFWLRVQLAAVRAKPESESR